MKIIKLKKNQKLFKEGYTHAFRFDKFNHEAGDVIRALNRVYNNRQWRGKYWAWTVERGSWRLDDLKRWHCYTYIAVRSEAVTTQVLLSMQ